MPLVSHDTECQFCVGKEKQMSYKETPKGWGHRFNEVGSNMLALRHLISDGETVRGHRFREIRVQWKDDSVLVILKKDSPKGPQIAFLEGIGFEEAIYITASAIKAKSVPWKLDKWKMRNSGQKD